MSICPLQESMAGCRTESDNVVSKIIRVSWTFLLADKSGLEMHYATSPLCVACGSCNEAVGAINRPLQPVPYKFVNVHYPGVFFCQEGCDKMISPQADLRVG